MTAFALALAVFLLWSVLGWSLISALGTGRNLVRNALLSPALGAAALSLLLFELYRLGLPVRIGGPIATVVAVVGAAVLLWRVRRPVPVRALLPFGGLLLVAALLTGSPLLQYGFDWVSFCNDDMANYVLTARAMLTHGYLSPIDPRDLIENRDPSVIWWLSFMLGGVRNGSELMLAWVMSCTGIDGLASFMPTILALHLMLVAAGSALVCGGRRHRVATLAAGCWLSLSSLMSLGMLYQLIAQVYGLGLLAAAAALLLRPDPLVGRASLPRRALLGAIPVGALGFSYPEVLPFLILAFGLSHTVAIVRGKENWKALVGFVALLSALAIALLNTYASSVVSFLGTQVNAGAGRGVVSNILFPYYLIPSGLAVFWGLQPIAARAFHPAIDIYIVLGAILLAVGAISSLWMAWRGEPSGAVATVMLALAVRLFMTRSDFGLYKLAMFVQPFLLGAMTLAWFTFWRRAKIPPMARLKAVLVLAPVLLIALSGFRTQQYYVRASTGSVSGGGFVEIPGASSDRVPSRLRALAAQPKRDIVLSDSPNVVLAKFEGPYMVRSSERFLSKAYFKDNNIAWTTWSTWYAALTHPGYTEAGRALFRERQAMFTKAKFEMRGTVRQNPPTNEFVLERDGASPALPSSYSLVATGSNQIILNRSSEPAAPQERDVRLVSSEQVRNHLVLIDSDLGKNYYLAGQARADGRVAMYQLEPDYFFAGQTNSAIGATMLFEVLNPAEKIRLVLDYTASLNSDGANVIPPVDVIGDSRAPFPAAGRGSARLFSTPIASQRIQGRSYVSIDMGTEGQQFPEQRTGLMRMYGADIMSDARKITGFARDISAIDDRQFDALHPPSMVSRFPNDLSNVNLEYSGIYEDGWIAESSYVRLLQPAHSSILRIRVMVPGLAQQPSSLQVMAGGVAVAQVALRAGDNDVKIPLPGVGTIQQIELHFDRAANLPSPDNRPVSALLRSVGFEEVAAERKDIAAHPVTIGDHWYPFETFAGNSFRWVANDAQFRIKTDGPMKGVLAIEVESGPGLASKPFRLELRGEGGKAWALSAHGGREVLSAPVGLRAGSNSFTLHVTGGGLPTPNDPRTLNFRVFSLTWQTQP